MTRPEMHDACQHNSIWSLFDSQGKELITGTGYECLLWEQRNATINPFDWREVKSLGGTNGPTY